jgi:hypothetical protein
MLRSLRQTCDGFCCDLMPTTTISIHLRRFYNENGCMVQSTRLKTCGNHSIPNSLIQGHGSKISYGVNAYLPTFSHTLAYKAMVTCTTLSTMSPEPAVSSSLIITVPNDENGHPYFHVPLPDRAAANRESFDPTPVGVYNFHVAAGIPSDHRLLSRRLYAPYRNAALAFLSTGNSNKSPFFPQGTFHPFREALYRDTSTIDSRVEWSRDSHKLIWDLVSHSELFSLVFLLTSITDINERLD